MHDPATAEVWQTAFGKDFGGMTQGDNKTGQKGTNSVFVMTHKEIDVLTRESWWTTDPKKKILIKSESQSVAT
jgi:hypothetical protein